MTLLQLEIEQFRCISRARMDLNAGANIIVGANASGKTSVLEAIFLLGAGHSFRTHQTEVLIQQHADALRVVARVSTANGMETLGIQAESGGKQLRVNGEPAASLAELALRLPVQAIDPDIHRLLEDGPIRRRRFMDWGVFHVEPGFREAWRRYQRALRQRNAALRAKAATSAIQIWDQELIDQGERVVALREKYLNALRPFIQQLGQQLLNHEVEIDHYRGWKKGMAWPVALADSWPRDQLRAATCAGPHRADLVFKVDKVVAKDQISRGQQKLLACVLVLAQQAHRASIGAPPACLLLDDPAAELDVDNLEKLLQAVAVTPAQLVVTSLSKTAVNFFPGARWFHVEHGVVHPMA